MNIRRLLLLLALLVFLPVLGLSAQDEVTIEWWSHWANEPSKVAFVEAAAADYMAANPNVTINVTWWDKNPLRDAIRSTMTAGGDEAPDITTFDSAVIEWVEAGWMVDIGDHLPWDNFLAGTDADGSYESLGIEGNYKMNLGGNVQMILYNKDIFAELGIEVPEDFTFSGDEFLGVVEQCSAAGYAGVADAIGNRPYPGVWAVQYPLFTLVGAEEFQKYNDGLQSWDTDAARSVLGYTEQLRDAGFWPESFSTMTIDEFHVYFHTQRQACMLMVPTWYAGRAFAPQDAGGQDPNWHFGMLRYPVMEGSVNANTAWGVFESGYGVLSSSDNPEVAADILAFMAQPKYGALWTAVTNIPSVIKYDIATDWPDDATLEALGTTPGQWDWYWAVFGEVYGPLDRQVVSTTRCGDFEAAVVASLNEGIPLGLVSVDEAVEMLDAALCM